MSWSGLVRGEPYRVLFPLGACIGAVGVGTWVLAWLGLQSSLHGQAHALAQSQAFLMAFVAGFLMTMIPRRTGAPPASTFEVGAAATGLVGAAACGFADLWIASQACAVGVATLLLVFAARRFRHAAGQGTPEAFVLLPVGLLIGITGGLLVAWAHAGGPSLALEVGRGLVQEAQFLALILGAGHLVLPILTGHEPPANGDGSARSRARRAAHVAVALAFVAGVLVERFGAGAPGPVRLGLLVRAGAFVLDAMACMHGFRLPRVPGLHRRLAWVGFWLVPAGLLLAAAMPGHRVGALHLTFVGGFSLLTLAVATHVIAAHGGHAKIVSGSPWGAWAFGVLILVAAATRVSADLIPAIYLSHLGWAAVAWILGLLAWAALVVPKALRGPAPARELELPVLRSGPAGPGGHC